MLINKNRLRICLAVNYSWWDVHGRTWTEQNRQFRMRVWSSKTNVTKRTFLSTKNLRKQKKTRGFRRKRSHGTSRFLWYQVYERMTVLTLEFLLFTLISFQPVSLGKFRILQIYTIIRYFRVFLTFFLKLVWTIHSNTYFEIETLIKLFIFFLKKCSRFLKFVDSFQKRISLNYSRCFFYKIYLEHCWSLFSECIKRCFTTEEFTSSYISFYIFFQGL